jgi:DUF4097 and DUF4098 domain-containing protein YvlB
MPARGWPTAVGISAAIVIAVVGAMGIGWLTSTTSRSSRFVVAEPVRRVALDLSSGNVVIVGTQGSSVEVHRTDAYAFGHPARERRSLAGGELRLSSACPRIVVGDCSASYELAVPETVAVNVRTATGKVRLTGFRGTASVTTKAGDIDVEAYCGFDLAAASGSGNVRITAACAPARLEVRTRTGDATALVPPGRYRISAISGSGAPSVNGLTYDARAPFTIDVHSGSGRVTVGAGL